MTNTRESLPVFIRKSYSRRLLTLLLAVILLIAGIGGVVFIQTGIALEENTEQNLEQSTELQANTLAEWIQRTENSVEMLATTDDVGGNEIEQVQQQLDDEADSLPGSVSAVHAIDSTFEIQASTTDAHGENLDQQGVTWAENDELPADGETVIVDPYTDPLSDEPVLATVTAVPDTDRYLVAIVDLEAQSESLSSPSPVEGAFTHVVNSNGAVVMSHQTEEITTQNIGDESDPGVESMAVMEGLEGETGYMEMEMDHGLMTMGYAPVEGTDWVIMTHIPEEEAFALQSQIGQLMLLLVATSLVGLGAVGVVVGRNTGRTLTDLASKARELEDDLETELHSSREDELGQLYDAFGTMRDSLQQSLRETEAARAEAEQQRTQLERFARELEAEAGTVMALAADGDLTRRITVTGESDELEWVAAEYNEMIDEIERTIAELRQFAETVATRSEDVTVNAEEIARSSESVSDSVQTISERTTAQEQKLQTVSENVSELSGATEEIASLSVEVSEVAEKTAQTGEEGRIAAQEAIDAMDTVNRESKETAAVIETLHEDITQVEEIANAITDITKQMNMIALNASIEASRSDVAGDGGFSAVATEVKELSEQSKQSAEMIGSIAEEILTEMERATAEVKETRAEITASQETVKQAATAHEEIADYAKQTFEGVSDISAGTQQQAASSEEIFTMVEQTAELSSAVAEEAAEVAAATEEQTAALTEMTDGAKTLSDEANDLQNHLGQFDVSAAETDQQLQDRSADLS